MMMASVPTNETLSDRFRPGGLIGGWCGFASFAAVELMCQFAYDFLVLDMQHCEITQAHLPALFGAFPAGGPLPVVRAPENGYHVVNWLFDQGAAGVLVPMVNSPEDARAAVRAAKYPPLGRRSFGPFRAARYGTRLDRYVPEADRAATLIVQIEDAQAAREIDAILAVPGIDAVFMGPNDLAYSMLRPGEALRADFSQWTAFARTPEVVELCTHVLRRCQAAGIPFGMTAGSMEEARSWLSQGARFATFGSDFLFLRTGARHLGAPTGERA
jgi:4-hydroxy-2-oxoheptanedioate aldolase